MRAVVLDFEGVDFVDSQGTAKLNELKELADAYGISLRLARVKGAVRTVLAKDDVVERIGADRIHGQIDAAVAAERAAS